MVRNGESAVEMLLTDYPISLTLRHPPVSKGADKVGEMTPVQEMRVPLIGTSNAVRECQQDLAVAVSSDVPVLISGERGVGKEAIARMIHQRSRRSHAPLVAISCAGVEDSALESHLFGRARESARGTHHVRRGCLERADGGTLLLNEVSQMGPRVQAGLLRFLESGAIQPVGGDSLRGRFDVRIISVAKPDLFEKTRRNEFSDDLYYRLNVIHVRIPPLRERQEDIPELLDHFLSLFAAAKRSRPRLTAPALRIVESYDWPGNVRELRNLAERLSIRSSGLLSAEQVRAEISHKDLSQMTADRRSRIPSRSPVTRPRQA